MVKGDDGKLLQHTCELAALRALVKRSGASRFHLYSPQAGAPREPCEPASNPAGRGQFLAAMRLAAAKAKPLPKGTVLRTTPLIDAYATAQATEADFPNTAGVISQAAKDMGVAISGVLVDGDPKVEAQLRAVFPAPSFRVASGDWRVMPRYRASDTPWLFASVFQNGANADDLKVIGKHAGSVLLPSKQPGVVTVMSYSMQPQACSEFWYAAVEAFGSHPLEFVAVAGRTSSLRHVAAIMSTDAGVLADIIAEVRTGLQTVEST